MGHRKVLDREGRGVYDGGTMEGFGNSFRNGETCVVSQNQSCRSIRLQIKYGLCHYGTNGGMDGAAMKRSTDNPKERHPGTSTEISAAGSERVVLSQMTVISEAVEQDSEELEAADSVSPEELAQLRSEKLAAIQKAIAAGAYDSDELLEKALQKMLERIQDDSEGTSP